MSTVEGKKRGRALVTGSSGFIGGHIVDGLLAHGFSVAALVRPDSRSRDDAVQKFKADFARPNTIITSGALDSVDYVFHVAGVTKRITREQFFAGNVEPTQNLLEAIKAAGVRPKRFVLLSSQAVTGPSATPEQLKTEAERPAPIEWYGESKMIAEHIVQEYGDEIPFTIVRPCSVYGPGDVDFFQLFKQAKRGFNIYAANRRKYLSIIYIDDLIQGILACASHGETAGKIYHLCNDEPVTWETVQNAVLRVVGRKALTLSIPQVALVIAGKFGDLYARLSNSNPLVNSQKIKLARPDYWVMSNARARAEFGFAPQTSLEDGLRITYDWYRQHGWLK